MNSQIQAFEDQAGVPFRREVLDPFGDEMVSFSFLDTDSSTLDDFNNANPTFYAVSLDILARFGNRGFGSSGAITTG